VWSFNELKKRWDDHVSSRRHHPGLAIEDAGLVLGADTILVRMDGSRSGAKALAVEADRERLLTLLGISYWDRVPPGIVKNIEHASEQWRRGDKVLAHIHLAFTGLPRLESTNDVYRLYLAGALLDDGLPPREMLTTLGLGRTLRQIAKYAPDQPRVPSGSGRESGQWTKDESLAAILAKEDHAATQANENHRVRLAGDVIYVGTLVGISISRVSGEIPRTTCIYESALGNFEWSFLGVGECQSIRRVP
jgi:hypothetical protein